MRMRETEPIHRERLTERFKHDLLTVGEVSDYTGFKEKWVVAHYKGWQGTTSGKCISIPQLAREMARYDDGGL